MTEDYEDWMICVHSSGNEPGCVGCWYGSTQRARLENVMLSKENKLLRETIDRIKHQADKPIDMAKPAALGSRLLMIQNICEEEENND